MQIITSYDEANRQLKCPFIDCFAGMGLAGLGRCGLHGMWWSISCPEYLNASEELERWRKEDINKTIIVTKRSSVGITMFNVIEGIEERIKGLKNETNPNPQKRRRTK